MLCRWWTLTHKYAYIYTQHIPTYRTMIHLTNALISSLQHVYTPICIHHALCTIICIYTRISHYLLTCTHSYAIHTTQPTQCQHVILCIHLCTHMHTSCMASLRSGTRQANPSGSKAHDSCHTLLVWCLCLAHATSLHCILIHTHAYYMHTLTTLHHMYSIMHYTTMHTIGRYTEPSHTKA